MATCSGDSGSPIVKRGEGQLGVHSHRFGPCGDGLPTVSVSVRYHRSWILNQISG